MDTSLSNLRLTVDPLLDPAFLAAASFIMFVLAVALLWQNGRKAFWRILAGLLLILVMLNPSLVKELYEKTPDVALVVVDRSPSQSIGDRPAMTDQALAYVKKKLEGRADLELRVQESEGGSMQPVTETRLFETIDKAMADVPASRRAGTIVISDGRIADVPSSLSPEHEPVHLLLTGHKQDTDMKIHLLKAPAYGLTGKTLPFTFRIDTAGLGNAGREVEVTLRLPDGSEKSLSVPVNEDQTWDIPVLYPGQNVFEMTIPDAGKELTLLNNRAVFSVTGVRDRLRVLLVTGTPHPGERTWRDLFKSDSGVDLIHFTILRTPMVRDATPQDELSLIAFPIRELFEIKLKEFDLVVLDRFQPNGLMAPFYFENLRNYVDQGGALLEISGPSYGTEDSLYNTSLGGIYPARPNGTVIQGAFKPELTKLGQIHPVTQTIAANPVWGAWLQFMPVTLVQGDVLMTATGGQPLLILSHSGKGRIAQMASDQIWLWSRGYQGGGPTQELLRRIAHWLMKEPELEEDALDVAADAGRITVKRRKLDETDTPVTLKKPDGSEEELKMEPDAQGWLTSGLTAKEQGIYEFSSGSHRRIISYGDVNSPELRELIATRDLMKPVIEASKGGVINLEDTPEPEIRSLGTGRDYGGRKWIALRQNNSVIVTGTEQSPLLPPFLALLVAFGIVALAWWQEGRSPKRS
jgi:hypothetical protein